MFATVVLSARRLPLRHLARARAWRILVDTAEPRGGPEPAGTPLSAAAPAACSPVDMTAGPQCRLTPHVPHVSHGVLLGSCRIDGRQVYVALREQTTGEASNE